MFFDCPEQLRRAIKSRAAIDGLDPSAFIVRLLTATLTKEIADALRSMEAGEEPPQTRRGRKPKTAE